MKEKNALRQLPTESGELDTGRVERIKHELEPWEKRWHALADVLGLHKIILKRRQGFLLNVCSMLPAITNVG